MTAVYNTLLKEDSYRFIIMSEVWCDSQNIIILTSDDKLVFRKAKRYVHYRKERTISAEQKVPESFSILLCDLIEAAVQSASYYDYYSPDDGRTYYYAVRGKAAIHHSPWPNFPLQNPGINNVKSLCDILDGIKDIIFDQNVGDIARLEEDILSLTDSFRQESLPIRSLH